MKIIKEGVALPNFFCETIAVGGSILEINKKYICGGWGTIVQIKFDFFVFHNFFKTWPISPEVGDP